LTFTGVSQNKTLITHARSQAATYLGYEITAHHDNRKGARGRRWTDGFIKLSVPPAVIKAKTAQYLRRGKPAHRPELINQSDYTIVATFGARYRGLVQYYLLAGNVYRLRRLEWAMRTSMLRTLAAKHRSSVSKMKTRHKVTTETPHGRRTCFEARIERQGRNPLVARFGGIPSGATGTRCSTTAYPTPPHIAIAKSFNDYCTAHARSASRRTTSRFTRSVGWPTSPGKARAGANGPTLWRRNAADARPLRNLP
jgi:hypothetical protein